MSHKQLAVKDGDEGRAFIRSRIEDVGESLHPGMYAALKLVPAKAELTLKDAHDWVEKILDLAATAPEAQLRGLAEALDCLLSNEEWSSDDLIAQRRGPVKRRGWLARTFKRTRRHRS
jgi:hypothetical protein